MKVQTKYTNEFKIEIVKKVVSKSPDTTLSSIARSFGLKTSTLHGWVKAIKDKILKEDPPTSGGSIEKIPSSWTSSEKLEAILDTSKLSSEEISEYCRKKGIFPHHLKQWKQEFIHTKTHSGEEKQIRELKLENKRLNTELNRKEKALAEAAALLVLKKKAQKLWKEDEDGYFL